MRLTIALGLGMLAGCGFQPTGLGSGDATVADAPGDDGAGGPDGAVSPIDAATDARPIDATLPMCPARYVTLGAAPGRYRESATPATWAAAAADCNDDDDGGDFTGFTHLLVIANDSERVALTSPPPSQIAGNTWVGLSDLAVEGTFVWVTGEPTLGYPVVGQEPPWDNDDPDGERNENCVRFKNNFQFEDKPCGAADSYVCECDAFPPL